MGTKGNVRAGVAKKHLANKNNVFDVKLQKCSYLPGGFLTPETWHIFPRRKIR